MWRRERRSSFLGAATICKYIIYITRVTFLIQFYQQRGVLRCGALVLQLVYPDEQDPHF
jgi:hypothetical protein